jgi:hypothetical protein
MTSVWLALAPVLERNLVVSLYVVGNEAVCEMVQLMVERMVQKLEI